NSSPAAPLAPAATAAIPRPAENTAPPTPVAAPTAAPGRANPSVSPAATAAMSTPSANPPAAAGTGFEISVAAFRTTQRAGAVAQELSSANLPVSTRPDSTGSWNLVIVGPYRTSTEAEAARTTLVDIGFTDARILPR